MNIFRAGTFVNSAGVSCTFTERDLRETAAAYNGHGARLANVVLGHPEVENEDETAGPVLSLNVAGDRLFAMADIKPRFIELVRRQLFKNVSASFFGRHHASNPVPGINALRHVGLLGAIPPALHGLQSLAFCDMGEALAAQGDAYAVLDFSTTSIDFAGSFLAQSANASGGFVGAFAAADHIPGLRCDERVALAQFAASRRGR